MSTIYPIRIMFKESLQSLDIDAIDWDWTIGASILTIKDTLEGTYFIILAEVKWFYVGPAKEEKK